MYDPDKFKNKAVRTRPSQARGKERVRVILAAALELFKEQGIDDTTTNDIAKRAGIPIGSLYRYYPNKCSIVSALTELYVDDISKIFIEISKHPMLQHLSWEEVLFLIVDGWANYSRLNGPFNFFYAQQASPTLREHNGHIWNRLRSAFAKTLRERCSHVTDRQAMVCFGICATAMTLGVDKRIEQFAGENIHHEMTSVVAAYMTRVCDSSEEHHML